MHRRYDKNHIPIELLRTFVTIGIAGSFTRAGRQLGLTQSAVSAQVKRLQQLVGGEIFVRSGTGLALNERGKLVAKYARRILDMNDQILALTGTQPGPSLRIGLSSGFAEIGLSALLTHYEQSCSKDRMLFWSSETEDMLKHLLSGFVDVALLLNPSRRPARAIAEWREPLVWVGAHDLQLNPASPVPLVSWPGSLTERIATGVLELAGRSYVTTFSGPDLSARRAATAARLGVMVEAERCVPPSLVVMKTPFLPPLPEVLAGIYMREGLELERAMPAARALEAALRPQTRPVDTAAARFEVDPQGTLPEFADFSASQGRH